MAVLGALEPTRVFHYFEEICKIPHGSGNVKAISDYLKSFAEEHNLYVKQDEAYNIFIVKEASAGYENAPTVMLQGHMDMVCEKTAESTIDFSKDGLELAIDGDWIYAKNTTLGGDDGIAVAYALALLEGNYAHPRLEVLITVDEEIGMLGATAVDLSQSQAKYLLNADSEEEGILTVGCAGGVAGHCDMELSSREIEGLHIELSVEGLTGGHSGVEIQKERGNANILMGRLLYSLSQHLGYGLESVEGGTKDNAIPRASKAIIWLEEENEAVLKEVIEDFEEEVKNELRVSDPDFKARYRKLPEASGRMLVPGDKERVIFFLRNLPNGVAKRSTEIDNLVQTSNNLGILKITLDRLHAVSSVRSSVESEKYDLSERIAYLTEFLGGEYTEIGDYPGWEYRTESKLRDVMTAVYEEQTGNKPKIEAIHAGLECGILSSKIEDLDCVSFGPDMKDIHTAQERLSISSVERVWKYLLTVLERLNESA